MSAAELAIEGRERRLPVLDPASWRSPSGQTVLKLVALAVVTLIALVYRKPDQFRIPAVWGEDGVLALPDYIANGWWSLFHPIAGYFSLPIKFIHALSATLSFRWMPEIELWLMVGFTYAVLATIATSPTTWRVPFIFAIVPLAIPMGSETYAASLYAGWWGSLLALPPLFWRQEGPPRSARRLGMLVLGGLSSPLILFLTPLYVLRAALLRTRDEYVTLAVCAVVSVTQAIAVWLQARTFGPPAVKLDVLVDKFFGQYLVEPAAPGLDIYTFYIGASFLAALIVTWWLYRRELGLPFVLMSGFLVVALVSSLSRVSVELIDPKLAAQRYCFFPFIALSWMVLQIAALDRAMLRVGATFVLGLAGRNALDVARQRHDLIDWRGQVEACMHQPSYALKVHATGATATAWIVSVTGEQCRKLVGDSWFDNELPE